MPHVRKSTEGPAAALLRLFRSLLGKETRGDRGERGERLAAEWLKRERGFSIVARNWRNPRDRREEIDLVCMDGDILVFVEVKTRTPGALVPGYYAIDERKKRALRRAIEAYLAGLNPRTRPKTYRFDVVEIALPAAGVAGGAGGAGGAAAGEPEILHFENVPLFAKYFRG
ncbi:MAG: YraN family protein [Verrucomicrobiota bacterium]